MAIWLYAASKQSAVLEKLNVWGRMMLIVMATGLGTETVGAVDPTTSLPFAERQSLSEPGDGMGFASSPAQPSHLHEEHQRWIF